jgi:fructokinase
VSDRRLTVVGLGEILWDLLPAGRQLGGAPANFAYHAQALGGAGVVVSCVGADDAGREILRRLEKRGLATRYIATDPDHPTGTVSVALDVRGNPDFTIHEGVAWDFLPRAPELLELAARADAVCYGSLAQRSSVTRETIRAFLEATRPECLRVFDVNLRQRFFSEGIVRASLDRADVLKLNEEELPVVAELLGVEGTETEMLDVLLDRFSLRAVALTRGERGSLLRRPGETAEHPGFQREEIADTVGAGDAFTAAMVMGLLQERDLWAVCEGANRLAAYVCSQPGAMPAVPPELTG